MDSVFFRGMAAAVVLLVAGTAMAQGQGETLRPGDPGRWDYQNNCASCHGMSGRGDGPLVRYLKVQPTDLTQLSKRNGGAFPKERVTAMIDGRASADIGPHGTREMPVWGSVFNDRMKQYGGSDVQAEQSSRRRIDDLVDHLLRMQVK